MGKLISQKHLDYANNLTDGQIRRVADDGGVIGIRSCSAFASQDTDVTIGSNGLVPHIKHIVKLVGDELAGLGLDCCGQLAGFRKTQPNMGGTYDTIPDHCHLAELAAWMIGAGFSDSSTCKILGANFHRVDLKVICGGGVRKPFCR